jgi:hypothetical protein
MAVLCASDELDATPQRVFELGDARLALVELGRFFYVLD